MMEITPSHSLYHSKFILHQKNSSQNWSMFKIFNEVFWKKSLFVTTTLKHTKKLFKISNDVIFVPKFRVKYICICVVWNDYFKGLKWLFILYYNACKWQYTAIFLTKHKSMKIHLFNWNFGLGVKYFMSSKRGYFYYKFLINLSQLKWTNSSKFGKTNYIC